MRNRWMRGLKSTTLLSLPPVPLFEEVFNTISATVLERSLS